MAHRALGGARSTGLLAALAFVATNALSASTVELVYDAAGNLKQIKRQAPYGLAVTAIAPEMGPVGTAVTIYGLGFSTTPANNTVTFNGTPATVLVADIGSLSVQVPAGATSGPVSVAVGGLVASSAHPFTVLTSGTPPGYPPADIVTTVQLSPGGAPGIAEIGSPGKHAAIVVNLVQDTYYTMQFGSLGTSPTNARVDYKVFNPDNSQLQLGSFGMSYDRHTIHFLKAPATGTYTVMVTPGQATFTSSVTIAADPVLLVDGATAQVTTTGPFQSTRSLFDAAAGQRIGMGVSAFTLVPDSTSSTAFNVLKPDGAQVTNIPCYTPSPSRSALGNCDGEFVAPVAGRYSVMELSALDNRATYGIRLSNDATGTLSVDTPVAFTLSRLGQDGFFTFTGAVGDNFALALSAVVPAGESKDFNVSVFRPNGTLLNSTSATSFSGWASYLELGTLAAAGTYTVVIDPAYAAYGTGNLALRLGALLDTTSAPTAFSTADASDTVRLRFNATAGDNLSLGIAGLTYVGSSGVSTALDVLKPDGSSLNSVGCSPTTAGGRCKLNMAAMPVSGTYIVRIKPPAGIKISGTIALSADVAGTLTPGTPVTLNITRQGQNARYTFSGTAGDSTSIELAQAATTPASTWVDVIVYRPNGTTLVSNGFSSNGAYFNLGSLPTTGTYTVFIGPNYGVAFSGRLTLDPGTALAIDGASSSLSTSVLGETIRYTFAGTTGTRIEAGVTGLTYSPASSSSTNINIVRPDEFVSNSTSCATATGACEVGVASLPVTGTYAITLTPPSNVTITGGSIVLSTPQAGTFTVGGGAQTIALARAGQTARYTFSGTASQLLRLNWAGTSITGGTSVAVSVLKPDGNSLVSSSYANGATGGVDIPSLPTTGTYTVVIDPPAAATTSAPTSLVTR